MDVAPAISQRSAQPYAGIRAWVTMETVGSVADRIPEIFGWLGAHGIAPDGPPFFRYHVIDMAGKLLVEAGIPVATPVAEDDGDIRGETLPAGRFAVLTHTGAPETLVAATAALLDWAAARGLAWDVSQTDAGERWGCRLESYLTDPAQQPDASKWQTELALRLADLVDLGAGGPGRPVARGPRVRELLLGAQGIAVFLIQFRRGPASHASL